jgi:hypothetical protein
MTDEAADAEADDGVDAEAEAGVDAEAEAGVDAEATAWTGDDQGGHTRSDGSWAGSTAGGADGEADVDPGVRDAVVEDLSELAPEDPNLPSMDDPIDPQTIDVENAVFVTIGAIAIVWSVLHLLVGFS